MIWWLQVIAHRLSTIRNADVIVVLAGGKVGSQGAVADRLRLVLTFIVHPRLDSAPFSELCSLVLVTWHDVCGDVA